MNKSHCFVWQVSRRKFCVHVVYAYLIYICFIYIWFKYSRDDYSRLDKIFILIVNFLCFLGLKFVYMSWECVSGRFFLVLLRQAFYFIDFNLYHVGYMSANRTRSTISIKHHTYSVIRITFVIIVMETLALV